ncbi:MAG: Mor transcription activator family protein [Campylobacter sp.]|nr:Mor transcription activator family protein [Campylobacter sp.]
MKSQNLELLLELIGIENFAKLAENCGGMSFYIPKMPSKKLSILRDIKLLKELEVSKDDIIKRLAKKYELSHRTLRRIYDRA